MTAGDILSLLTRTNLAAAAAIVLVLVLRKIARPWFGARLVYTLWFLPMLAAVAVLAPARAVILTAPAASVDAGVMRVLGAAMAPVGRAAGPAPMADLKLPILAAWLVGVVAMASVMILLQRRFAVEARKGAIGPAVVGVIAPRIVTPADFKQTFSAEEQVLVLAHEGAHIERQDSRLNGLWAALQCLFWFNPLIHLAAHLMRIDQEMACDELVVSRFPNARRAYAQALLKAQLAFRPLPLGCHWPSAARHPLLERIAMLKANAPSRRQRLAGGAALAVLGVATPLAAWASQPPQVRLAPAPTVVRAADLAATTPDADPVAEAPAAGPVKAAKPGRLAQAEAAPPAEAATPRAAAPDPPLPIAPRMPVPPPSDLRAPTLLSDAVRKASLDYITCQMAAARALDDGYSSEDAIATQLEARCEGEYQAYRRAWIANNDIGTPDERGWLLDNQRQARARTAVHSLRQSTAAMSGVRSCVGLVANQSSGDSLDQLLDQAVQRCGKLMPLPVAPASQGATEERRGLQESHDKAVRAMIKAELTRWISLNPPQPPT